MLKLSYSTKHIPTYAFDRFRVANCVIFQTNKLSIQATETGPMIWELVGELAQLAEYISLEWSITVELALLYVQENSTEAK